MSSQNLHRRLPVRWGLLAYLVVVLLVLVYPFTSSTFRDNDQAALLSGGWQIAHHQVPFWHAWFYNYDKQWGTFLALGGMYRLLPGWDPVYVGNLMQVIVISAAWITLAFRTGRNRRAPLILLLPVLASPALILYAPFLGTSWFSLAFFLLAFYFAGSYRPWNIGFAAAFIFIAAACRGDVVLAIPAFVLSQLSRASFVRLLRRPYVWIMAAAAITPVFVGKLIDIHPSADHNPLGFDWRGYVGVLVFGLTPAALLLVAWILSSYGSAAVRKRRFRFFYGATALAPLIPLAFYTPQLYTIRYFFLTIASALFIVSSRRSTVIYRAQMAHYKWRVAAAGLAVVAIAPWFIGVNLRWLWHPEFTFTNPTRFPTGDGHFPMGAYLSFDREVLFQDQFRIDHNQRIWLAAESVPYETCSDGTVPIEFTPMTNYLELAVRLQKKTPKIVFDLHDSPCGILFIDSRSLTRELVSDNREARKLLTQKVTIVSQRANTGQPILRISKSDHPSPDAELFTDIRKVFRGKDFEIYFNTSAVQPAHFAIRSDPASRYVFFSDGGSCTVTVDGRPSSRVRPLQMGMLRDFWQDVPSGSSRRLDAICSGESSGWAKTVLPGYMGI
ncbi:MAG TPA: hypothetical protein VHZ07_21345 [Bryobacteraceae bacterium]|jgi:hypothetical protein|nr:hypothetical protein [Bryobacteraceae bacterium]